MKKNSIFEVDTKGLRQLQESKPKYIIIRELIQNAFDEEISKCDISLEYKYGKAYISVEDDSPAGFRNLADAYTLFAETYKRTDVRKRGKFNFGEKQVICLCDYAKISSTTGAVEFNLMTNERRTLRAKRECGSQVYVVVRMTQLEYQECISYCNEILIPDNVSVTVKYSPPNLPMMDKILTLSNPSPLNSFQTKLPTTVKEGDSMRNVTRETIVVVYKPANSKSFIYEMGIPVCEIDCDYSLDVLQKIPLSVDRDNVDAKYLKTLYGEVLNVMHQSICSESASNGWVRNGFESGRTHNETRKELLTKRFGEKALIANPFNKRSMDEAISNNYKVIGNSELSIQERQVIKENELLLTTSQKFRVGVADGKTVIPDAQQVRIRSLAIRMAKELLLLDITVSFYDSPDATVVADFCMETNRFRFNVANIDEGWWLGDGNGMVKQPMLDLIIHELGHSAGWHYEHSYHDCLTKIGSMLALRVAQEPAFIKLT